MKIKIKDKDVELKFTFNSFRYIQDLTMDEIEGIENKPFSATGIIIELMFGAVNHDPKVTYSKEDVVSYLNRDDLEYGIMELFEMLMVLLEESSFFKNLHLEKPTPVAPIKKSQKKK